MWITKITDLSTNVNTNSNISGHTDNWIANNWITNHTDNWTSTLAPFNFTDSKTILLFFLTLFNIIYWVRSSNKKFIFEMHITEHYWFKWIFTYLQTYLDIGSKVAVGDELSEYWKDWRGFEL